MSSLPILNYHGIQAKASEYPWEPGEKVYVLPVEEFQSHLDIMGRLKFSTLSLSELEAQLKNPSERTNVMITFDDGHLSHYEHATPRLALRDYSGLFFISAGLVGKPHQMDWSHMREMLSQGMEFGSHGYSHIPLPGLSDADLKHEVSDSKKELEDKLGTEVDSFSIPRGFFHPRILEAAKSAGYKFMFTSKFNTNSPSTNPFRLNRIAIKHDVTQSQFEQWLQGQFGAKLLIENCKEKVRTAVPPSFYESLAGLKRRVFS